MKKLRFNRPLRRRKPEETPPDGSEVDYEWSFLRLLKIKGGLLLFPIAILGVGGIVVISVAPLLVLGILLFGFALWGVLQKEWSRTVRFMCGVVASLGLCLSVYSGLKDGDALVSRLKLVVDKVRPGPSKADLERTRELNKEEASRRKSEYDLLKKMSAIRKRYSNLPAEYPELLEEAHALAELSKKFERGSVPGDLVRMQFEEIKTLAYYHHTEFGHLPIYKKIYGTDDAAK